MYDLFTQFLQASQSLKITFYIHGFETLFRILSYDKEKIK